MSRKNKLLSIGEISKFTGVSKRSLRYYERIGLLEPAFIDPDSGYRYYALDQTYLIDMISYCIELDIPLKELKKYIDANGTIHFAALLAYGKRIAEEKLRTLERGLKLICDAEQKMELAEKYRQGGQIYAREVPEKIFYVVPCEESFERADELEIAKVFLDLGDCLEKEGHEQLWEFGLLCEYSPRGVQRYVFMELQKQMGRKETRIIPGGLYLCKQNDTSQIEEAPAVFGAHLAGGDSFLAIETEIFTGRHKISRPVNELRVIAL